MKTILGSNLRLQSPISGEPHLVPERANHFFVHVGNQEARRRLTEPSFRSIGNYSELKW